MLFKDVGAVIGIGHYVGLTEGQLGVAVLQLLHVGLRAVAHQADHVDTGVVGGMLSDDAAECVIGAGLAAGDEAQLGLGVAAAVIAVAAAAGRQAQSHDQRQDQCKKLFHDILSSL